MRNCLRRVARWMPLITVGMLFQLLGGGCNITTDVLQTVFLAVITGTTVTLAQNV